MTIDNLTTDKFGRFCTKQPLSKNQKEDLVKVVKDYIENKDMDHLVRLGNKLEVYKLMNVDVDWYSAVYSVFLAEERKKQYRR